MILANRKLLTRNQAVFYRVLRDAALEGGVHRSVVIGVGETGTGKTYVASRVGMELLMEKKVDKIVLLTGDVNHQKEKENVPVCDCILEYTSHLHLTHLLKEKTIEIASFSHLRGRTFSNAFIVADDAQNTTQDQMKTLLTRIGSGSQLVITGDLFSEGKKSEGEKEERKEKKNGLANLLKRLALTFEESDESSFSIVHFTDEDIMRSELTRKIIKFYQQTDDLMTDGGRYI